ncbi:MAG: hypothetical protein M3065_03550 [Actinomycetota bacterium]|nr:hypothetical protein [Actinomycetota bacterium]
MLAGDPESGLGTTALGEHDYWQMLPRVLLLDQRLDAPDALPMLVATPDCASSMSSVRSGSEMSYACRCATGTACGAAWT